MVVPSIKIIHRNNNSMKSYTSGAGDNIEGNYPVWLGNGQMVWGTNNDLFFKVMKPTKLTETKQILNVFPVAGVMKGLAYDGRILGVLSQRTGFPFSNMDFRFIDLQGTVITTDASISTNSWVGLCFDGKYWYTIDVSGNNINQLLIQDGIVTINKVFFLAGSLEQDITFDGKYFYVIDRAGAGSPPRGRIRQILLGGSTAHIVKEPPELSGLFGICWDGLHYIIKTG